LKISQESRQKRVGPVNFKLYHYPARSDRRFSALSFKDSLEEQGVIVDEDAVVPLLTNMQSLSEQWRESVGRHRELVFYVDNC